MPVEHTHLAGSQNGIPRETRLRVAKEHLEAAIFELDNLGSGMAAVYVLTAIDCLRSEAFDAAEPRSH